MRSAGSSVCTLPPLKSTSPKSMLRAMTEPPPTSEVALTVAIRQGQECTCGSAWAGPTLLGTVPSGPVWMSALQEVGAVLCIHPSPSS